jgi:hypothetical protein
MTPKLTFSSHCRPKVIVPKQISDTLKPVRPIRFVFIAPPLLLGVSRSLSVSPSLSQRVGNSPRSKSSEFRVSGFKFSVVFSLLPFDFCLLPFSLPQSSLLSPLLGGSGAGIRRE